MAQTRGVLALPRVPQPEITDLVEAARQHMLEEATHELLAAEAAKLPTADLTLLVAKADMVVVKTNDTGVGERDAEHVAGEVVEHGLFAATPQGNVGDPGGVPDGIWDDEIGTPLSQQRAELAADQAAEGLDRDQEVPARGMPSGGVLGDPAAGDQAVRMRVVVESLIPGV